ncbi:hypothetical protein PSACC_03099 [Paramicrosporidium saccamoebae]|uniref:RING-CH-type domain-containing protein n=1 Tax=Paramicrosporidium saccamoebae TaxID=1246581 RepID=A0A2H9THB6_9FUNG|nr:hypothetical protein PSACC_03099 [Paramicrosporidium saccamoebae]
MDSQESGRQCWICFEEGQAASAEEWVRPCRCRGTSRWVHQKCLLSWLDKRAEGDSLVAASAQCPQCHTEYRMAEEYVLPRWILRILDRSVVMKERILMYASLGGFVASAYLVSFAYGVGTTAAVLGRPQLVKLFSSLRGPATVQHIVSASRVTIGMPLLSLYVLSLRYSGLQWLHPFIPALVWAGPQSLRLRWPLPYSTLASMIPLMAIAYEGIVRQIMLPALRERLVPSANTPFEEEEDGFSPFSSFDSTVDEEMEDRTLKISVIGTVSTLLLPVISSAVGYALFGRVTKMDPFHRTVLGGVVVIAGRDLMRTLMWYQRAISIKTRRVLDYVANKH